MPLDNNKYSELLNEAKTMFALGYDNRYIELQFAEKKIDDNIIDQIIVEIKSLRKAQKKSRGLKLIIYGASFIAVAFIMTLISYNEHSSSRFVLWGLAISGVTTLMKGVADILGL
ncbi:MAG: hypothetical protein V4608_17375 [Bacteroidota bacterium]